MNNNFTTVEQSFHLLDLGIPKDTADCYICRYPDGDRVHVLHNQTVTQFNEELRNSYTRKEIEEDKFCPVIPCWSFGRLVEIFLRSNRESDKFIIYINNVYDSRLNCPNNTISYIINMFDLAKSSFNFNRINDFY